MHFQGLPPDLEGLHGEREQLPQGRVLVIEQKPDGIFLYRYAPDGTFAGDTWHQSVEEALEQADYEYGHLVARWQEVPAEVADAAAFAMQLLGGGVDLKG